MLTVPRGDNPSPRYERACTSKHQTSDHETQQESSANLTWNPTYCSSGRFLPRPGGEDDVPSKALHREAVFGVSGTPLDRGGVGRHVGVALLVTPAASGAGEDVPMVLPRLWRVADPQAWVGPRGIPRALRSATVRRGRRSRTSIRSKTDDEKTADSGGDQLAVEEGPRPRRRGRSATVVAAGHAMPECLRRRTADTRRR